MHTGASPPQRPIIVVGCPRSGTTLLSTMLHAHPRLSMPPETRFLMPVYRGRAEFGDLREQANRRLLADRIVRTRGTKFRDLGLDRDLVTRRIVDGAPTVGTAIATVFQSFAQAHGKARWGEKRPAYWADIDVILRLFPDAQIVHLIRDPRACVASIKKLDWWVRGFDGALATWMLALERLPRDTRHLPADSYTELYFEQLVRDPRAVLTELCAFLGEDFDEAMLEHHRAAAQIVPGRKTWHRLTARPVDTSRVEAWRGELTAAELGLVEFVAGRRMQQRGYRLSHDGTRPSPRRLAEFGYVYARRRAAIRRDRITDLLQRRHEDQPVAAVAQRF